MKFDTSTSGDVAIVGDVQSNKIGIDQENISFLITILSTNLYSNPIESFIRETVSNAWDSHVEAGVTEPVILELGKDTEGKYFCKVKDFGVGLSPDRFNKIYRNIGSSTKRDTNDQIGMFGIGRFAALSYSDIVYITTNFDGICYKYMMYKDGNSISIDLLYDAPTDELNGLEVLVYLKRNDDIANFCNAIRKQLTYFENLFILDTSDYGLVHTLAEDFNNFQIKKYTNFQINTLSSNSIDLILGKVRYPLRKESLTKSYPRDIWDFPISLSFEVGDLEVTPNREEVLYSTKNINKIQEVLDAAIMELKDILKDYLVKDFTDFHEYLEAIRVTNSVVLLSHNGRDVSVSINKKERRYTLNRVYYRPEDFLHCYDFIYTRSFIKWNYSVYYNKISGKGGSVMSLSEILSKTERDSVYISDVSSLKGVTKDFIRETIQNARFISVEYTVGNYIELYLRKYRQSFHSYSDQKYDFKAFKIIIAEAKKDISKLKIIRDKSVTKEFLKARNDTIAARKAAGAFNKKKISHLEVNLYRLKFGRGYNNPVTSEIESQFLDKINTKSKKLKIYAGKDSKDADKLKLLYSMGVYGFLRSQVELFEVAPTRMKLLKDVNSCVELKDFLNVEYKLIRKIATARLIKEALPFLDELSQIANLEVVSVKLKDVVQKLYKYRCNYYKVGMNLDEEELSLEIYELCKQRSYFDEEMRGLLQENKKMLDNAAFLIHLTEPTPGYRSVKELPKSRINFIIDYIILKKLFRPNLDAVKALRQADIPLTQKVEPEESKEDKEDEPF